MRLAKLETMVKYSRKLQCIRQNYFPVILTKLWVEVPCMSSYLDLNNMFFKSVITRDNIQNRGKNQEK